ncbi:MAG: hypothetical protein B6D37_10135 [Sphingobacteriales bacterium UTBCD1]|nr:MAG: hypothetical protein B6D37_10135 [Sphingobacteriales bacterium UTBCD1]
MNAFFEKKTYLLYATDAHKLSEPLHQKANTGILVFSFPNISSFFLMIQKFRKLILNYITYSFISSGKFISSLSIYIYQFYKKELFKARAIPSDYLHRKFTNNVEKSSYWVNKFYLISTTGSVPIRYLETLFPKFNCTANLL